MGWWSEWFIPLLIASGVLLIFKGGTVMTIFLWLLYLSNGAKTIGANPSEENEKELANHTVVGAIVVLVSIVLKIVIAFD